MTTKVRRSSRGNCKLSVSNFFYLASLRAIGTIAGWRTSFCANISTEFGSHKTLNGVAATFDSCPFTYVTIFLTLFVILRFEVFICRFLRINFEIISRFIHAISRQDYKIRSFQLNFSSSSSIHRLSKFL